jgi:hypothetical protein
MKKIIFLWIVMLFWEGLYAQKTDSCKVGVYITSLYDFKIKENSFTTIFWLWRVYQNDSLKFDDGLDIVNAKNFSASKTTKDYKGKNIWTTQKIKAECKASWHVKYFPFDKQRIQIKMEDSHYDASILQLVADKKNSKIDEDLKLPDWQFTKFDIQTKNKTYKTTYGDPTLEGTSQYSQAIVTIEMARTGSWGTFFKTLTGLFFAFAISVSVSLIPEKYFASRMPVCVGGLFSAVGSKYIAENIVPSTVEMTLIDILHNVTFLYILLCIVSGIISMQKSVKISPNAARKWDVKTFFILVSSYIIVVGFFTMSAVYSVV